MAAAIARTAHGSGMAAAKIDARTARDRAAASIGPCGVGRGGDVSGPCQPARAGTNCEGVCGSASSRCRSGRIGVAPAGTANATRQPAASAARNILLLTVT